MGLELIGQMLEFATRMIVTDRLSGGIPDVLMRVKIRRSGRQVHNLQTWVRLQDCLELRATMWSASWVQAIVSLPLAAKMTPIRAYGHGRNQVPPVTPSRSCSRRTEEGRDDFNPALPTAVFRKYVCSPRIDPREYETSPTVETSTHHCRMFP
jgi:hypothetical protein